LAQAIPRAAALFASFCRRIALMLAVPRAAALFESRLAARHVMDAREGGTFWKSFFPMDSLFKNFLMFLCF